MHVFQEDLRKESMTVLQKEFVEIVICTVNFCPGYCKCQKYTKDFILMNTEALLG